MISPHSRLLWKALYLRLVADQKRLFVFALVTVSLGVSLALGIRLGTESASRSLEENIPFDASNNWSKPVMAQGQQAIIFLRERALQQHSLVFSIVEAQVTTEGLLSDHTTTLQLVVPWSGSGEVSTQVCDQQFAKIKSLKIEGRAFPVRLKGIDGVLQSGTNCRLAMFDASSLEREPDLLRHWRDATFKAPLRVVFKLESAEQKFAFTALRDLAFQVPGIDFGSDAKRVDRLRDVTRSFRTNLQLMGFIAIFIGFAMVRHVFSLIIARQSKTLATLTALGIPQRRQIGVLMALAATLGIAASGLGTILGLMSGFFLSLITSSTVRNLYDSLVDASRFYWQPVDLLYGFAIGFSACILGVLQPVFGIRRLPVAQVMRDGSFEAHQTGLSFRQSLFLSMIIFAASMALLKWTWVWNRIPLTALASCLGILVAASLVAHLLTHALYHRNRLEAHSNKWRKNLRLYLPPQSAVVVQVLTLTFTLTFGVKGMAESFRKTVADWSRETLQADLWIRTVGGAGTSLPDAVLERLERARGSEALAIDSLNVLPANLAFADGKEAKPVLVAGANMRDQSLVTPMKLLLPPNATTETQAKLAGDIAKTSTKCQGTDTNPCPAYISEPVQVHFGLASPVGTRLCPEIQGTRWCFEVVAVYQDFGSDQGVILSDKSILEKMLGENLRPGFANVYLPTSQKGNLTQLEKDLREFASASDGALGFETLAELQARILETFDNTFRVTDALYVLCGIIAVVATISGLNMQIFLRRREWNVQWALGFGSEELGRRFSIWSAVMAMIAAFVSIAGGAVLSAVLVYSVNYYSFGYSLSLAIPWHLPVAVVGVAGLSGWVSGRLQSRSLVESLSAQAMNQE
ncbi:MAG: FtsX-like permease family protein [Silvanigrellaceae bacterium]